MRQMTRISVPVSIEEREALRAFAERDFRHPQEAARLLLRQALGLDDINQSNANRGARVSQTQRAAIASK